MVKTLDSFEISQTGKGRSVSALILFVLKEQIKWV